MQNILESFVDYLFDKADQIDGEAVEKAKQCTKDYASVTAAGAAKNREKWAGMLDRYPNGRAQLLGYEKCVDSHTAALINGFNAHCLELDDGQRFAMIHLGASIISAVEAAGADYPIGEEERLRGIIMGYEAACRLSIAMQPSHKQKGYHAAGTCGTVGAAVAVGFALGLSRQQMKRVVTLAAGSAAGMLEIQEQKSEVKPYNLGRAAMDGLTAAYMGKTTFDIPDDMLGGERGFFTVFSDSWDPEKLTARQEFFEIRRIYVKPYASCRHSHSAVEAALLLRESVEIDRIRRIEVETYRLGIKGHDHNDVQSVSSAKLSTPYAVAAALLYGRADLSVFEPLDEAAVRLAAKVGVVEDPELTAQCPEKRVAIVRAYLDDGSCVSKRVDYAKGEPENPMTPPELAEKWEALSRYAEKSTEMNEKEVRT